MWTTALPEPHSITFILLHFLLEKAKSLSLQMVLYLLCILLRYFFIGTPLEHNLPI